MKETLMTRLMTAGCMLRYGGAVGGEGGVGVAPMFIILFLYTYYSIFFTARQRANAIDFFFHSFFFQGTRMRDVIDCNRRLSCLSFLCGSSETLVTSSHNDRHLFPFVHREGSFHRNCLPPPPSSHSPTLTNSPLFSLPPLPLPQSSPPRHSQ